MSAAGPPVCVVGAGRLARALTARLPTNMEIMAVSRRAGFLPRPANHPDLQVGSDPSVVGAAQVILMAVPAASVHLALRWLVPHLRADALVANTATEIATPDLAAQFHDTRVIGCKVVGQAGAIEGGARPVFVLSGGTAAESATLRGVLSPVGEVIDGDERIVADLNRLVATRIVRTRLLLEADLRLQGLAEPLVVAGAGTMAAGVWRALADDDAGPFLREVVQSVEAEWGTRCR